MSERPAFQIMQMSAYDYWILAVRDCPDAAPSFPMDEEPVLEVVCKCPGAFMALTVRDALEASYPNGKGFDP